MTLALFLHISILFINNCNVSFTVITITTTIANQTLISIIWNVQNILLRQMFTYKFPTFYTLVSCLAYPSTLNMDMTCPSETSVGFQQTTQHYIPADRTIHEIEFAIAMSILIRLYTKRLLVVSNDQRTYSLTVYFQVNQAYLMPPTSNLNTQK